MKTDELNINQTLFFVEVSLWKNGSGRRFMKVLCDSMMDAVIVKESLKKTFPNGYSSEIGDVTKSGRIEISISPVFDKEAIDFIKDNGC